MRNKPCETQEIHQVLEAGHPNYKSVLADSQLMDEVKQLLLYGATGNLAILYLIPCCYQLWRQGKDFKIIAISLENWSTEEFCNNILQAMKEKKSAPEGIDQDWHLFTQTIVYIPLDLEANYELPNVA